MLTGVATVCHQAPLLQYYWQHSLCCAFHPQWLTPYLEAVFRTPLHLFLPLPHHSPHWQSPVLCTSVWPSISLTWLLPRLEGRAWQTFVFFLSSSHKLARAAVLGSYVPPPDSLQLSPFIFFSFTEQWWWNIGRQGEDRKCLGLILPDVLALSAMACSESFALGLCSQFSPCSAFSLISALNFYWLRYQN